MLVLVVCFVEQLDENQEPRDKILVHCLFVLFCLACLLPLKLLRDPCCVIRIVFMREGWRIAWVVGVAREGLIGGVGQVGLVDGGINTSM